MLMPKFPKILTHKRNTWSFRYSPKCNLFIWHYVISILLIYSFIYLFICLFVYLFIYLLVCLFIYLSTCLFVCLFICVICFLVISKLIVYMCIIKLFHCEVKHDRIYRPFKKPVILVISSLHSNYTAYLQWN